MWVIVRPLAGRVSLHDSRSTRGCDQRRKRGGGSYASIRIDIYRFLEKVKRNHRLGIKMVEHSEIGKHIENSAVIDAHRRTRARSLFLEAFREDGTEKLCDDTANEFKALGSIITLKEEQGNTVYEELEESTDCEQSSSLCSDRSGRLGDNDSSIEISMSPLLESQNSVGASTDSASTSLGPGDYKTSQKTPLTCWFGDTQSALRYLDEMV